MLWGEQSVPIHAQTARHWEHLLHVELLASHPSGLIWCPSDTICSSAVRQAGYMTSKSTRRDCFSLLITSPCHCASCCSIQRQLLSSLPHSFEAPEDRTQWAASIWKLWNVRLFLWGTATKLLSLNILQVSNTKHRQPKSCRNLQLLHWSWVKG